VSEPGRSRRGLVLGGGGVLGGAWMIGALRSLEEVEGFDPRTAHVLVGTSAGSVLATLVGAGTSTETLLAHQRGIPLEGDPRLDFDHDTGAGGPLPPWPHLHPGSARLLLRTLRNPRSRPPAVAVTAFLPEGRGSLAALRPMIEAVTDDAGWVPHPSLWVVAMDYDTGRRVAFGRADAPPARLVDAVLASCAIPGWYAPVTIGGRRYLDGGVCSPFNADLLAGLGLDEVVVLAPMASARLDRPYSVTARVERCLRRAATRRLAHEVDKLRRSGTDVVLLCPGPADLEVIGANLMDPRRRERVLERSLRTTAEALRDDRTCRLPAFVDPDAGRPVHDDLRSAG
jgi:NTE family protein